jgi:hypothetical protein
MKDERNLLRPWSVTTLHPFVAFVPFCKKVSVLPITSAPVGPTLFLCTPPRATMDDEGNLPDPWSLTTLHPFVTFCKKISVLPITSVPVRCAPFFEPHG